MSVEQERLFLFIATQRIPPFTSYIGSYDIALGQVQSIFPNGLDSVGAPRLSPAHIPEAPSLVYLYTHSAGLFSIDFLSEQVILISDEHHQSLGKFIHFTDDKKTAAILKMHGSDPAYSDIELYPALSRLTELQFVLNQNDQDGIQIDDLRFSGDANTIFVSIRTTPSRWIENYFGSYDVTTKQLYFSPLKLPWSINPYYLAHSPKRKEVYMVGALDTMYVIGVESIDYYVKGKVTLTGKVEGPSRLLVRPDEEVVFVSCFDSDIVFAVDLERRVVAKTISINAPYLMLLLE